MNRKRMSRLRMLGNTRNALAVMPPARATAVITARVDKLVGLLEDIASIEQRQLAPLARPLQQRDNALAEMAEMTLALAGLALSHVTANALPEPTDALRVPRADLLHNGFQGRVEAARRLLEALRGALPRLDGSGVTAEQLAQLQAKIDAAAAAILLPRDAIAARQAAREALETKVREAETLVRDAIDPLIYPLRLTEPEFYRMYRAARELVKPAVARAGGDAAAGDMAPVAMSSMAKPEGQPLVA